MPLAPARLSITTCWPRRSESLLPMRRPTRSVLPPGVNPMISLIGRWG